MSKQLFKKIRLPKAFTFWFLFFIWLVFSYMVFSALWGNTESTVGQRGNIFLFLQNVASYLIFFPNHIGGLIFDLPFSFLMRPEYIFYIFIAEIALGIFLIKSKQFRNLVLRFGLPLFISLGLFALMVNILTIRPCVISNQHCFWWRIYTPNIIGLYGMALCCLFPVAKLLQYKPAGFFSSLKQTLLPGLACGLTFILIYFISIYIPWELNARFARDYGLELMRSYQTP